MYNYLSNKTADYTAATFSVKPTTVLPQAGKKSQVVHEYDDGSVSVVGLSSTSYFDVELQWAYISPTDYSTLMGFYHDATKADGMRKTFYWLHPVDGKYYTVRFMSPLRTSFDPVGHRSVDVINLRVEGNKPA